MKNNAIATLCALSLGTLAASAQNYNNLPLSTDIIYFGNPNTATYGQTFTAPAGVLDDWTFYLQNDGSTAQNFEFFVMGWNGTSAAGPVLYQSPLQTIPASDTGNTAFTVNPNLSLTTGNNYVMFINESGLNSVGGQVGLGGTSSSPIGGAFEYLNNGDDFSQVTTVGWNSWIVPDAAFNADFSSGSAPDTGSSMLLMSLSLGGIAALRRRFAKA